ncbi:MAG: hypothetical protein HUU56_09475 [Bdellovibrionaceae bacterium]|nr:hypothetical protein [Pseudobdellovibrionaceae bacterium]
MKKYFSIFVFLLFCRLEIFAYVVDNDISYKIKSEEKFQYILPENKLNFFHEIKLFSELITPIYEQEFEWLLDEKTSIVLTSEYNQIANAFAMTTPNNLTVYYVGGVDFLELSASSSWLYLLSTHERAHIYQLNVKQFPTTKLKYVFGNSVVVVLPYISIPIFITPNQFLPTFIVEGNAVLNESRFNLGGRLHSGEARALVNSMIINNKGTLELIMNDNILFPFGNEKYLIGGYFQSFLAEKYGIKKVNSFFKENANRFLNPFFLNLSFSETFYQGYETLYKEFLQQTESTAKHFQKAKGKLISNSLSEVIFNDSLNSDKIIFSVQTDGKSRRKIYSLDKKSKSFYSRESKIKSGKIFELKENQFFSVNSDLINKDKYLYSLFDEEQKSITNFEGKYIHDIKNKVTSYFLMSESIDKGALYINDRFITNTESKSLLDNNGNIYYFKQEGKQKNFYKNFDKIFTFQGYYGILQQVISDNEIYFTANTDLGSGLFCFCNQKILRIVAGDNIVRSFKIDEKNFILSTLTAEGYEVLLTDETTDFLVINTEQPTVYNYKFSSPNNFNPSNSQALSTTILQQGNNSFSTALFHDYFSLREMRFSEFSPSMISNKNDTVWLNQFSFVDPLFWSNLNFGFSFSNNTSYNFLNYTYTPYIVDLTLDIENETKDFSDTLDIHKYRTNSHYFIGIQYPIINSSFFTIDTSMSTGNESVGDLHYFNTTLLLSFHYMENYFLNYKPYRSFSLNSGISMIEDHFSQHFLTDFSLYLGDNFYLSVGASYSDEKIETLSSKIKQNIKPRTKFELLSFSPNYIVSKLQQRQIELLHELAVSKYYFRFPFSLRRLAPFISFQQNDFFDIDANYKKEKREFFNVGIEAEILLVHKAPARVRIFQSEITTHETKENLTQLVLETNFK